MALTEEERKSQLDFIIRQLNNLIHIVETMKKTQSGDTK